MAPASCTHQWQTMLAGKWREIGDSSLQDALEAAFTADSDGYRFSARGYTYEVDFSRMKQVNTSTKRERGLRRVPDPSAASVATAAATSAPVPPVPKTIKTVPAKSASVKTTASAPKTTAAAGVKALTKASGAGKTAATSTSPPTAVVCPPAAPVPTLVPSSGCIIRQGRVKTVLKAQGYGFIVVDGKELFFHVSIPGGDSVQGNDIVEVEVPAVADLSGRMRAKRVCLLRRGSILKQMCKNKCCLAKGERHWEDRCPRGGSTTSVITTTAVVPKSSTVAPSSTAAVAPKPSAVPPKTIATACARAKAVDTTKACAVRLQNRFQMFADGGDSEEEKQPPKASTGVMPKTAAAAMTIAPWVLHMGRIIIPDDKDVDDGKTDDSASTDCS